MMESEVAHAETPLKSPRPNREKMAPVNLIVTVEDSLDDG